MRKQEFRVWSLDSLRCCYAMDSQFSPQTADLCSDQVVEILETTDFSPSDHVSGIDSLADVGTKFTKVENFTKREWLTGQTWLKQPDNEWHEQVNLQLLATNKTYKGPS